MGLLHSIIKQTMKTLETLEKAIMNVCFVWNKQTQRSNISAKTDNESQANYNSSQTFG